VNVGNRPDTARQHPVPLGATAAVIGWVALRRLARRSGVTDEVCFGSLPGDDVIPHPMIEWTRGTTIGAPPDKVWPWLVQMGYGRGGWYTSERFDRIVWRVENPSSETILPEWQQLAAGDIVPDGPDYAAYFRVVDVRHEEAIVYYSIRHPYRGRPIDPTDPDAVEERERELVEGGEYIEFSWVFVLSPVGATQTRLHIRTRANLFPPRARLLETPLGLVDLFHVATIFRGIERRVVAAASADR
jgi:hypothetical protein